MQEESGMTLLVMRFQIFGECRGRKTIVGEFPEANARRLAHALEKASHDAFYEPDQVIQHAGHSVHWGDQFSVEFPPHMIRRRLGRLVWLLYHCLQRRHEWLKDRESFEYCSVLSPFVASGSILDEQRLIEQWYYCPACGQKKLTKRWKIPWDQTPVRVCVAGGEWGWYGDD